MGQEIAISVTREETRVAVLDNGVMTDLYVDRAKQKDFVGNIYIGRVVKVLPGMQAAFIDIGMDKAAFMHVSDLSLETEAGDTLMDSEDDDKGGEMPKPRRQSAQPIEALLKEGQELMVQISKGPIGTKGPRVTTYVSLPGRSLVFMPGVEHVGVSRRIPRDEERARLKEIVKRLRRPGHGYIVRTVSEGVKEEDLRSDVEFLEALWEDVLKKREHGASPNLLHADLSLTFRVVRDLFSKKVDRLLIDVKEEYEAVRDFVRRFLPDQVSRVHYFNREESLFDHLGIEMEIARALSRKVWLKSGGYIVVDHTEAMTVIDVNTGRFVGKRDQEETILKNNLEAVKEVAYQIKLRGIGGIIIIDFIDMEREKNRDRVYQALVDAMAGDKARTRISRISDLGLIEISRERVREDLLRTMSQPCHYCEGRGYTKSPTTVAYEIFRELRRLGDMGDERTIIVGVHPGVAELLDGEEYGGIEMLQRERQAKLIVKADPTLHLEQYDIVTL
ncbi:MAG: ribonuclease G [Nitrospirae bacterium RIFCSPLOWO2_02_FULL_62_14]|nr:MAG: ribonuclease G [Nitrospirae bacterium RIFCSPLOWO2_02_FULL_62_14]OGW70337.1 MAG: ribonuclease G [Nitrospirae bacterium RIFCSPLOWO2_01_FULL_62_17]